MYSEKLVLPESYVKREEEEKERAARKKEIEDYNKAHKNCPNCRKNTIEQTCMTPIQLTPEYKDTSNSARCYSCNWEGKVDDLL